MPTSLKEEMYGVLVDRDGELYGNDNRRLRREALDDMRAYYYESGMDDLDFIEGYLAQFQDEG